MAKDQRHFLTQPGHNSDTIQNSDHNIREIFDIENQLSNLKRIVVTGASGFIGLHLIRELQRRGIDTVAVGRNTTPYNLKKMPRLDDATHVVHLAAKTSVVESWDCPLEYFEANAMGTAKMLELCRSSGASFTYVASYPYGAPQNIPINEDHPLAAVNPYGMSKNAGAMLTEFYSHNYNVNANILRLFNVYGPGQPEHLVMPFILQQILDPKTPEVVVRDLSPKRDFLFIDDFIDGIMKSIRQHAGESFNVGSGNSYSVAEIIEAMMEVAEVDKPFRDSGEERKNEIPNVVADVSKIKKWIGWSPSTSLKSGLGKLIEHERTIANSQQESQ